VGYTHGRTDRFDLSIRDRESVVVALFIRFFVGIGLGYAQCIADTHSICDTLYVV
jgi:hypothetical protein